jgi:hypothetical protein
MGVQTNTADPLGHSKEGLRVGRGIPTDDCWRMALPRYDDLAAFEEQNGNLIA